MVQNKICTQAQNQTASSTPAPRPITIATTIANAPEPVTPTTFAAELVRCKGVGVDVEAVWAAAEGWNVPLIGLLVVEVVDGGATFGCAAGGEV